MSGGGGGVKETEHQRALAEVSRKRYNRYQQAFVGLENQFLRDVQMQRNPEQYQQAAGIAAAQTAMPFHQAQQQVEQDQFAAGIDPSSGRFQTPSLAKAHARGLGRNVATAQIAATDRYFGGMENAIALGQGQAGSAIKGMADVAQTSGDAAAQAARSAYNRSQGTAEFLGTAAGVGAGVFINNKGNA